MDGRDDPDPAVPWRVPGYLLVRSLGRGADAAVWQATVRRTGAAVALKLVPAADRGRRESARAEAATLSGLDHPHLVHLHEVVPCTQGLALVLDLAGGGSLRDLLTARGRLAPGEVVTALAPIGAALAYAHEAGVLHGDVSAANVLFTEAGLPLLADLGLSRLLGEPGRAGDPVRCTPAYVDPAVAAGGVPTRSSDVFMLAAVALHALTGEPPWPAASAAEATDRARRGEIGDLAARLRGAAVPGPVAEVVTAALRPDPATRPTAAEFALDLRHAAAPVAVGLRAGRARHRAAEPARESALLTYGRRVPPPDLGRDGWRMPLPAARTALVLAALLLVGGAGVWWALGSHGPGRAPVAARPAGTAPAASVAPSTLDVRAALTDLDALRARAYAGRDTALLAGVYASGTLRDQDAAQLRSLVPAGCSLVGVRTDYRDVEVTSRRQAAVTVRATASMAGASLECADRPAVRTAPAPARSLRIVLQRPAPDAPFRIAELTLR